MPADADKTGRESLPIQDQPHRGPVSFDARDDSAPQQPMLRAANGAPNFVIVQLDPLTEEELELVGSRTGAPLSGRSPFREPYSRRAVLRESAPEFHGK